MCYRLMTVATAALWAAALALGWLAGCGRVTAVARSHRDGGSESAGGGPARDGSAPDAPCVAVTCASAGAACGSIADGCGKMLDCGPCRAEAGPPDSGAQRDARSESGPPDSGAEQDAAGDAAPNRDGCVPLTCAQQGFNCGLASDACSHTIDCGTCLCGSICGGGPYGGTNGGTPNVCGPSPACACETCAALNLNCGLSGDGCGGLLHCGTCTAPQTCGGGGIPGVCGP